MTTIYNNKPAFGKPGLKPHWTMGNKDGVGTAHALSTRLWFSLSQGVVTEVYYPTIDSPQIRELQYAIGDGKTFILQEKDHIQAKIERLAPHVLGYQLTNADPEGRYQIHKEIITDATFPCLLQQTKITGDRGAIEQLKLYVFCSPHLGSSGWENDAAIVEAAGWKILTAKKDGVWLAMVATVPFTRLSCGYIGESDGWTDLEQNYQMDWEFDSAEAGNVALTGEIALKGVEEFILGVAFGDCCHDAITTLLLALDIPYSEHRERYIEQWNQINETAIPLESGSGDGGSLYDSSFSLLLAHEDKTYPGATIASLSIPWGQAKSYDEQGAYHLVWPRDMVNTVTGLLAAGHFSTALEALIYLSVSQCTDGGFAQNFWLNGDPHWTGSQLDQVSFPITLAWRMHQHKALRNFDPYPMVLKAARYMIDRGPATEQERWEENYGYSPSTLASNIAALICAGALARENGDDAIAEFLEEYADFLEAHLEPWTVTNQGTLVPEIPRHYIRINPVKGDDPHGDEDLHGKLVAIANRPSDKPSKFPASEIVDAGFLELVRYGIRSPDDPLIVNSLKVVDAMLKVDTPYGPCWHRYNHDGFGQREDGGPFKSEGKGRAWPILTGERGHYELAAGRDVKPYLQAMEGFASSTGLLPEQIWDEEDRPELGLYLGKTTGAAMPLAWAHSEYIKLLRSLRDGQVFDFIPEVADRYLHGGKPQHPQMEMWKFNRQISKVKAGSTLRILAITPFQLHWSPDGGEMQNQSDSQSSGIGIEFVDLAIQPEEATRINFTFFWPECDKWEDKTYQVEVMN
ncbi:glycoside hydrolase family 15 protein [Oscillatoria acuminata]|uniref:Glycosyl hydrolase, glucoamylase n=1 Tax=Oscillatoria acuminata PCC 6304 TaxID=56110 RepID=K9TGQ5_9CYAN|nr:glycoside hydrolase family 15 protein [Oscillatoria acuminata]AFY82057.1 glycosyl hydrolase, glucoamylase [Oscillatoria acuminata PCC 6304]